MELTLSRESQPIFTRSQKKQEVCVRDCVRVSQSNDKTVMCHIQVCVRVFSPVQGMKPVPLGCQAILWAVLKLEETYRSSAPEWSRNSWCTGSWSPACLKHTIINLLKGPNCRKRDFVVFLIIEDASVQCKYCICIKTLNPRSNCAFKQAVRTFLRLWCHNCTVNHDLSTDNVGGTDADAWLPPQACESWPIKDDQAFREGVLKRRQLKQMKSE